MTDDSSPIHDPEKIARAFFACAPAREWAAVEALLEAGVTRTGSEGSVITGRDDYLAYLRGALPERARYSSEVKRIAAAADGSAALVELDERLELDGKVEELHEVMVLGISPGGRIASITAYERAARQQ